MPGQNLPKTVPYITQTDTGGPDELDLTYFITNNNLDQIQSVYIDNKDGTTPFTLFIQSTGQNVTVKEHTQGWYPLMVSFPAEGKFVFSGATAKTPIFFSNVPMPVGQWDTQ